MGHQTIYLTFGKAVATRRRKLELTQAELAARAGISRASLANIESGRQSVLLHHLYGLADALQLDKVADLLPSLPKAQPEEDVGMFLLSDESVTPLGKAQIRDLIENALAHRGKKGDT